MMTEGFMRINELQREYWAARPAERDEYQRLTNLFWRNRKRGNLDAAWNARAKAQAMYAKSEAWVAEKMKGDTT